VSVVATAVDVVATEAAAVVQENAKTNQGRQ
jgi:hypothetical protein